MSTWTATVTQNPQEVWNLLTDFESWPRWNKGMIEAVGPDELTVGSKVRITAGLAGARAGRTFTIRHVDPPHELVLLTKLGLMLALSLVPEPEFRWIIKGRDAGGSSIELLSRYAPQTPLHWPMATMLNGLQSVLQAANMSKGMLVMFEDYLHKSGGE